VKIVCIFLLGCRYPTYTSPHGLTTHNLQADKIHVHFSLSGNYQLQLVTKLGKLGMKGKDFSPVFVLRLYCVILVVSRFLSVSFPSTHALDAVYAILLLVYVILWSDPCVGRSVSKEISNPSVHNSNNISYFPFLCPLVLQVAFCLSDFYHSFSNFSTFWQQCDYFN
jgi:hypothetical protein